MRFVQIHEMTPELVDAICECLSRGQSVRSVGRSPGMPSAETIRRWAANCPEFGARYQEARELGWHAMADECLDIADNIARDTIKSANGVEMPDKEWIARSRVRIDTRKWLLGKMMPKVYGDRAEKEDGGDNRVIIEGGLPPPDAD